MVVPQASQAGGVSGALILPLTELLTQIQTGTLHVPSVHTPAVCGHKRRNQGTMPSFVFHMP